MDGPVAIVSFTNPSDGFMDGKTVPEITAMLDQLGEDKGVRAIILTGGLPDVFIRHYSVVELEARAQEQRAAGTLYNLIQPIPERQLHVDYRRIEDSPKPFIAAINGTAMGGGFEMALCYDFRIA